MVFANKTWHEIAPSATTQRGEQFQVKSLPDDYSGFSALVQHTEEGTTQYTDETFRNAALAKFSVDGIDLKTLDSNLPEPFTGPLLYDGNDVGEFEGAGGYVGDSVTIFDMRGPEVDLEFARRRLRADPDGRRGETRSNSAPSEAT